MSNNSNEWETFDEEEEEDEEDEEDDFADDSYEGNIKLTSSKPISYMKNSKRWKEQEWRRVSKKLTSIKQLTQKNVHRYFVYLYKFLNLNNYLKIDQMHLDMMQ